MRELHVSELQLRLLRPVASLRPDRLSQATIASVTLLCCAVGFIAMKGWRAAHAAAEAGETMALTAENQELQEQLQTLTARMQQLDATIQHIETMDTYVETTARLIGHELTNEPLNEDDSSDEEEESSWGRFSESLAQVEGQARQEETTLSASLDYFQERQEALSKSPAIWPTSGVVTSDFGVREDPFTSSPRRHKGIDIANAWGTPVMAPASGIVVFAGRRGGYGNLVVIRHQSGLETRYGHLAVFKCQVGEIVSRRDVIALMGSTGRSTGPHLHYEVWVSGHPSNPHQFILESKRPQRTLDALSSRGFPGIQGL